MSERIYYCEYCADHYSGSKHCPTCGREGVLT